MSDDFDGTNEDAPLKLPSLRGKFLLASATLNDPNFARAIILIVRHDQEGALGVVINRPLGVTLEEACGDDVEAASGVSVPLFHGGPCTGPLVAVHNLRSLAEAEADLAGGDNAAEEEEEHVASPELVAEGIFFCSRREALEALMRHLGAEEEGRDLSTTAVKFVAGYAGWAAGQLEAELAEDSWQLLDADAAEVYAGGDERHPSAQTLTALPPGAVGLLGLVGADGGEDPASTLAAGVRQWVRLRTRANLSRMIDINRIPNDPSVN